HSSPSSNGFELVDTWFGLCLTSSASCSTFGIVFTFTTLCPNLDKASASLLVFPLICTVVKVKSDKKVLHRSTFAELLVLMYIRL
ncbi:hypothetical protein ADUPG1_003910, partial [Aduncisulcus paluster]